jgi:23S rRNA pseudouridine2605 synthase
VLLLTNDGDLANRLTHPRYGVPKVYRALVKGKVDPDSVGVLEEGVKLTDRTGRADRRGEQNGACGGRDRAPGGGQDGVEVTIREGRNRQVRRMLAALGFPVKKLERIAMGPLRLKGVQRGYWRELTRGEVQALKRAAAAAGGDGGGSGSGSGGGRGGGKRGRSS